MSRAAGGFTKAVSLVGRGIRSGIARSGSPLTTGLNPVALACEGWCVATAAERRLCGAAPTRLVRASGMRLRFPPFPPEHRKEPWQSWRRQRTLRRKSVRSSPARMGATPTAAASSASVRPRPGPRTAKAPRDPKASHRRVRVGRRREGLGRTGRGAISRASTAASGRSARAGWAAGE